MFYILNHYLLATVHMALMALMMLSRSNRWDGVGWVGMFFTRILDHVT